jgi:hypothetical protein
MPRMSLVSLCFLAGLAACDVGQVNIPGPGPGGPDGAPGSPDAGVGGPDAPTAAATCRNAAAPNGSGNHNAGLACNSGNCHGPAGQGPTWTVAGTLYTTAGGGTPIAGATITVRDANGTMLDLVTAQNGNFWTPQTVAMPVTVYASQCPLLKSMVATATGDCNQCHVAGSATGAVYLQ